MATMMKEKPRPKKKTKEKRVTNTEMPDVESSTTNTPIMKEDVPATQAIIDDDQLEDTNVPSTSTSIIKEESASSLTESAQNDILTETSRSSILVQSLVTETDSQTISPERNEISQQSLASNQNQGAYKDLCHRLDIISFKDVSVNSNTTIEGLESKLEASTSAYINQGIEEIQSAEQTMENTPRPAGVVENMTPSAPMFEESFVSESPLEPQAASEIRLEKLQCMPLEVAMHICGGKEMAEVREMSEREEANAGGMSLRPEHPLVDLLSTYRCSAIALEQESEKLIKRFSDEEKRREALWRVEKKTVCETEKCSKCERSVTYTGQYEHATLLKEKLPAAQLRLEGLLKDVQESYCTYQHQALLAYYQIEEFISETVRSSIGDIREALALVLQELRASDSITCLKMEYFTDSLKRWAKALCGALLGKSDARQLLFLLHQLFRQTHSVRWAAPLIRVPMCDTSDAARTMAILDLMLAAPVLETAKECTEAENEEMWEEVDRHGAAGAVSEGALRESDLLALLRAFPLQALVARLVLLQRSDITQTRPYEWQHAARDVVRACCGARALLAALARAALAHPAYRRLRAELRALAAHAQHAVADLHQHNRDAYPKELAVQIEAELEAIFCAGWGLLEPTTESTGPIEAPPASLLRPAVRAAYCVALMTHLHEKQPLVIDSISLTLSLSCGQCVHALSQAAHSEDSADTLSMVADFLVQVALKRSKHCSGACVDAARASLPTLLSEHDYLYTRVVHSIAYVHQLEPLQPSAAILKPFCLQRWRPSTVEIRAVLDDWSQRSALLLPFLLQELSYTPYDGLSLESQLAVGAWLCGLPAPAPDWAWNVLMRLRVHRSSWRLPIDAPPPEHTQGVFAEAYAVLSSSWGHSLPLICECGVGALQRVAGARAAAAAHALPLVMAAMLHSPESVGLTPQFASLTSTLLAPPQSLVQWARGEKAAAPEILLRRMLAHVENQPSPADRDAAVSTWLQALGRVALAGAPLAACDTLLLATRHTYTLQEAPEPEVVSHLVRNATHAPLACAAALWAAHAQLERAVLWPRLLYALAQQRANKQKIHVDNALKQIGANISSEELVIHQTAAALLAPAGQPSLPLWRLLMHLYLHSANISSDPAPIGPLFFSGLVKSRTLAQLKKRLHETILHHHNEAATFKSLLNTRPEPRPRSKSKSNSKSSSPETLLPMTLGDLTEESSASETDSDDVDDVSEGEERRRVNVNMLAYHEAAEKMLREYSCWLEAGDRLRATPHHADIARFIPDAALSTAWAEQLNSVRPAPSNEDDDLRAPRTPPTPEPPLTPLQRAVQRILRIKDRGQRRSQAPTITSPVGDVNFGNPRQLYMLIDKHLADVETFARQWSTDVNRVATLDSKLWPLVCNLRCPKRLPAVRKQCPNQCGPILLDLQGHSEWPISENADRGITENRASAKSALRELMRARPKEAKTVAALNTIARRISNLELAVNVAQRVWGCAGIVADCCMAHAALAGLLEILADRWICSNNNALLALVPSWCARAGTPAQQALCRSLLGRGADPRLYTALLRALCEREPCDPQRAFSYLSKVSSRRTLTAPVPSWGARAGTPAQQALCRSLLGRGADPRLYTALLRALCEREPCDPQRAFSYLSKVSSRRTLTAPVPSWGARAGTPAQQALCRSLLGRGADPRLYTALLRALCEREPCDPQRAFSYLSKVSSRRTLTAPVPSWGARAGTPAQQALCRSLLGRGADPRLYTALLRALCEREPCDPQRAFSYLSKVSSRRTLTAPVPSWGARAGTPAQQALCRSLLGRGADPRLYTALLRALCEREPCDPQRAFSYLSKVSSRRTLTAPVPSWGARAGTPAQQALCRSLLGRGADPRLYTALLRALCEREPCDPQRAFSYLSKVSSRRTLTAPVPSWGARAGTPAQQALCRSLLGRGADPRLYTALLRALCEREPCDPQRAFSYLSKVSSRRTLTAPVPSWGARAGTPAQQALCRSLLGRGADPRLYTALLRALCEREPCDPQRAFSYLSKVSSRRTLTAPVPSWGARAGTPAQQALCRSLLGRGADPRLYTALLRALCEREPCDPQRAFSYLSKVSSRRTLTAPVPSWGARAGTPAQQALCRSLLGRGADPRLYTALLRALCEREPCDPQRAFSYLSKFDMSRCTDEAARADTLEALCSAAQRWGREPPSDMHVLLELIGVHTVALTTADHLPTVVLACARAAAAGRAPPAQLAHCARAAAVAKYVPQDKLGHLLRELGTVWWRARADLQTSGATYHAVYAEHVAALQHTLQRAFVAQAIALSYAPERVSLYAWSALQESWAAWASPHPALPPLLPPGDAHARMLRRFLDNVHQCMLDCPGCEEHLLSQVWEWTIQVYVNVTSAPAPARDSRVQLSELLAQLGTLPWSEHQWPRANCLPAALQVITSTDLELQTWLADSLRGVEAATWVRGVPDAALAPHLAALLRLFAGPLRLRTETLEQAVHLPWQRLPEMALDQALERFFVDHHNPQHPYHDTPQFRVMLAASGLEPACAQARSRRACAVSHWTRAASAPVLVAHVASQAAELLQLLAALEPYVEEGSDELEELLARAVVIMCVEPAAAEALPVWVRWISGASPRVVRACASAARALTTLDYFASVADAAASAFMNAGGTWAELAARLTGCAWAEPGPLIQRNRLHAAYALALTAPAHPADLNAVASFASKELIVSVWICALFRCALSAEAGSRAGAGAGVAARAQLARWAEPPRHALLRVLTSADEPTNKHRLLCRLALCIFSPNSEPLITNLVRAYEACPGILVSQADLISWAKTPSVKHLPALAMTLFPGSDNYFAEEMRMAAAV